MTEKDEDLIKKRAYALWESEGRPEGRHDEHWSKAHQEHATAENTSVLGEPDSPEEPQRSEKNAAPVDKPAKAEPAKPPLSVVEGGAAANPGAKRKRKTV
ncbi:hypothetical protein ASG39_08930 [Rhizobium sp. Leaf371]|uniref:DUF2934 domain-containing protein n=1 Tax=Rhizobium sp. Leaf371 TaxID=1736355 RepID=UPI0007138D2E|nr:DUF2934 domain-containing protein [Rhizobium sp. Leaf371]KQS65355.1 hypothetical protein ASG39_08930 [Rhizobium sp. Leaf371]